MLNFDDLQKEDSELLENVRRLVIERTKLQAEVKRLNADVEQYKKMHDADMRALKEIAQNADRYAAEAERLQGADIQLKALRPKLADCEDALKKTEATNERLRKLLQASLRYVVWVDNNDDYTLEKEDKGLPERIEAELDPQ